MRARPDVIQRLLNRRRAIIPLISRIPREFRRSRVSPPPASPRSAIRADRGTKERRFVRRRALASRSSRRASRAPLYIKWCSRFTGQIESRAIGRFSISPDNGLCYRSSTSSLLPPPSPPPPPPRVSSVRTYRGGWRGHGDASFRDPWECWSINLADLVSSKLSVPIFASSQFMYLEAEDQGASCISDRLVTVTGRMSMPRGDTAKSDVESES